MKNFISRQRTALRNVSIPWKQIISNLGLISVGCIIFVIGLNGVLIPKGFLSGGLVGVVLIIHYMFSSMSVGVGYFILNIPLLLLGWLNISRRFMFYTVFGISFLSLSASFIRPPGLDISDPILAALFSGIICGTGGGIILRSLGSTGGLHILAIYLNKRFGFRVGSIIFAANALVLTSGAFLFELEKALYSIIFIFTSSRVIEMILTGFNRRKSLIIISDKAQGIAEKIIKEVHRGVTFLKGEGAYTGRQKNVIFTVTSLTELPGIKELVFSVDPNAFVVINDTLEVLGKRHGTLRVY